MVNRKPVSVKTATTNIKIDQWRWREEYCEKKVWLESSQSGQMVIGITDTNISFYSQEDAVRARNFKEIIENFKES